MTTNSPDTPYVFLTETETATLYPSPQSADPITLSDQHPYLECPMPSPESTRWTIIGQAPLGDRPGQIWSRVNVRLDRTEEVSVMPKKRFTPEEIIQHLRTVELETGKSLPVLDACRKLGVTEQTYYRWKKEYGGLRIDQAKRLKGLEQENARLKRIVADQAVDLSILKEVASGNF